MRDGEELGVCLPLGSPNLFLALFLRHGVHRERSPSLRGNCRSKKLAGASRSLRPPRSKYVGGTAHEAPTPGRRARPLSAVAKHSQQSAQRNWARKYRSKQLCLAEWTPSVGSSCRQGRHSIEFFFFYEFLAGPHLFRFTVYNGSRASGRKLEALGSR